MGKEFDIELPLKERTFIKAYKELNSDNKTLTKIYGTSAGLTEIGNHYILAPAFMKDTASGYNNGGWDANLQGIWVAKYETSMEVDGKNTETSTTEIGNVSISNLVKAVSKPGLTSWRNITINNSYLNSYNYNRNQESHMIKNSEWGALVYLAYSKYGLNGSNISVNKNNKYITGGSESEADVYSERLRPRIFDIGRKHSDAVVCG